MSRPAKLDINSGVQGWDGPVDDNDEAIFNAPIPIHEHSTGGASDETDLEATFAAAAYDRCAIWVNDSTHGWSLYVSNGTSWLRVFNLTQPAIVALTNSTGGTGNDTVAAVSGSGADTTINDNFSDLADKVNELRTILVDHGLAS